MLFANIHHHINNFKQGMHGHSIVLESRQADKQSCWVHVRQHCYCISLAHPPVFCGWTFKKKQVSLCAGAAMHPIVSWTQEKGKQKQRLNKKHHWTKTWLASCRIRVWKVKEILGLGIPKPFILKPSRRKFNFSQVHQVYSFFAYNRRLPSQQENFK